MAMVLISDQILEYPTPRELKRTSPPLYHIVHLIVATFESANLAIRSLSWLAGAVNIVWFIFCF